VKAMRSHGLIVVKGVDVAECDDSSLKNTLRFIDFITMKDRLIAADKLRWPPMRM
jgi:hypothetical protein